MRSLTLALPCLLLAAPALAQDETGARVTGELLNAEGSNIGSVSIFETPSGLVRVNVQATELGAGGHGIHMHETGECEGDFSSAGGHVSGDMQHGLVEGGPHPGDLPNGFVEEDGVLSYEAFSDWTSVEDHLLDDDGSALIIHSNEDDYESQPSGESGSRVACAVLSEAPS
ncbi:superoxide dismutase family protein [uncultured Jannaschia sp.]|uniref:superoxide dismutase family protein n=1 Tax=uncultured Jannaschia sp. TaxID=293347 RepID=UPI00260AA16C|nr:superoxide dismutase family protein [uncultured Jannaschia sp.]